MIIFCTSLKHKEKPSTCAASRERSALRAVTACPVQVLRFHQLRCPTRGATTASRRMPVSSPWAEIKTTSKPLEGDGIEAAAQRQSAPSRTKATSAARCAGFVNGTFFNQKWRQFLNHELGNTVASRHRERS